MFSLLLHGYLWVEDKVKFALEPIGPPSQSLFQFPCCIKWPGVLLLPPGWDTGPSQGTLPAFHQASLKIHPYPFIHLEYYYWMGHWSIARLPSQHFIRLPWKFTHTHLYSWSIITWWDTSPSQGYPPSISSSVPENSPVPIYTPRVLLLDGTLVHCKVTCPAFHQASLTIHQYLSTLLGDTVRVKCSSQERNTMSRPDLKPRPLNPESSALTIRNKGRYLAE